MKTRYSLAAISLLVVIAAQLTSAQTLNGARSNWQTYDVSEYGFTVAVPSPPMGRALPSPLGDGTLHVFESFEPLRKLSKFSVFVGQPQRQGIFAASSMDAFLDSYISGMLLSVEDGKLVSSRRTTFRGCPALQYLLTVQAQGQPFNVRGIIFMIDGGHMRISMWHPANDPQADKNYEQFVTSFQLKPIAFTPASTIFRNKRGLIFTPPAGWVSKTVQNSFQAALYNNLTRSLQVMVVGDPADKCAGFQAEMEKTGLLKESVFIKLDGQQFLKLLSVQVSQQYKVRLKNVQYCLNSRLGPIVLWGTEEEAMFWRWEKVFEGAASSLRVR